ncbi:cytochrome P450 [Aspergillus karnatakaensis]|uniref:cytochrome P450 n=1 Tax=Aspergillus karnatakaensis TaxID=1810916 RepID=UPI003CCDF6E6
MGAVPGVFAMRDIREHAARRRLLARAFGKSELRGTLEGVVRGKVRVAVQKMKFEMERNADGQREEGICDVLKWWMLLATDVAGHLMFGEDFGMVELGLKNEYIYFLESIMKGSAINAELPLPGFIARHIPITSLRAVFWASDYLVSYGRRAVTNARTTSKPSQNIISGMIHASKKSDTGLSELNIITEARHLIVAGSDTIAITLTYLVYAVLSQPQLQTRLEDEVQGLKEGYDDAILETLPLLNAVIKETLRLFGAASGSLLRDIPKGGAMLANHYIPEGFTVSTQSYTIHRDPEIYPNPEVFDISRWLGKNRKNNLAEQLAFLPFGAGSRICLGIHLAYMELRLAAAEFFRECRGVRLAPSVTKESMGFENYFLIAPRGHMCEVVSG